MSDLQTIQLADALKARIEEDYREAVAARADAESEYTDARIGTCDSGLLVEKAAELRYAISKVRSCEDARTQLAALIRTLEGM